MTMRKCRDGEKINLEVLTDLRVFSSPEYEQVEFVNAVCLFVCLSVCL
jgi:hypothetical protein